MSKPLKEAAAGDPGDETGQDRAVSWPPVGSSWWPSVGSFVAAFGQFLVAAVMSHLRVGQVSWPVTCGNACPTSFFWR